MAKVMTSMVLSAVTRHRLNELRKWHKSKTEATEVAIAIYYGLLKNGHQLKKQTI